MIETYGVDQERIYYVNETVKGTTPATPGTPGAPHESLDPGINSKNLLLRSGGNITSR